MKTLSEGVLEFWISLWLEKQPGSLVSFFGFSAIVAERGKKKKTPPVALVGAVAVLLEPPFENLASRRTASVLTWSGCSSTSWGEPREQRVDSFYNRDDLQVRLLWNVRGEKEFEAENSLGIAP